MKILTSLCATLAIICAPHTASAHDAGLSKPFSACMNQSGDTTTGMIECIGAEFKHQDVRLNQAYRALIVNLTPARKGQLHDD